jgi:endonuclease YncB( thermonuclease family)
VLVVASSLAVLALLAFAVSLVAFLYQTSRQGRSNLPSGVGQTDHNATVKVTRVVDGDTIDISPSVKGRSRVRLIGMDTPEVHFGTQPYGPEASAFAV